MKSNVENTSSGEIFKLEINKKIRTRIKYGLINEDDRNDIKKSGYGEELEELLKQRGFFGKKVTIFHDSLGQIHKTKIGLNENNEEVFEYTNDGFIKGEIVGVKFYESALWSIQLKKFDSDFKKLKKSNPTGNFTRIEIVPMETLDKGINIELIQDTKLKDQRNEVALDIEEIINT